MGFFVRNSCIVQTEIRASPRRLELALASRGGRLASRLVEPLVMPSRLPSVLIIYLFEILAVLPVAVSCQLRPFITSFDLNNSVVRSL
jgi:hypothetical protein